VKRFFYLAVGSLMAQLTLGQTATWLNPASGVWTNAVNWQDGVLPGAGIDASINVNGTYTNTVAGTGVAQNVTLGTTSASGVQMVQMSSSVASMLVFSNFTVGSHGVFAYADNSSMPGTGLVTVASGGQLYRTAGVNQGNFADHDIRVQPGGRWTVAGGAKHNVSSNAKDVTYTIDGTLDVTGHLKTSHSWAPQNQPLVW